MLLAGSAAMLQAHPMGNFSVSHYARFDPSPRGLELTYALDLAEIPTFELLQSWGIDGRDHSVVTRRATAQAREWVKSLRITVGGRPVTPVFQKAVAAIQEGAGGMAVLRVITTSLIGAGSGAIEYEDPNYTARSGWKEIVVTANGDRDRSHTLETYPADATSAPPQDVQTAFEWHAPVNRPPVERAAATQPAPVVSQPSAPAPARSYADQQQSTAKGSVVRGDYLSRMLGRGDIGPGVLLIGLCVAFGLGALHALSPGHGKTIVAAYLVGSRGTMKHALFLGGMVTFTHTVSVFVLGLGVLLFQQYVVPEKIIPVLGAISGLSIVAIGGMLLFRRAQALAHDHAHGHHHHHHHDHPHTHSHDGGHVHSHMPEDKLTLGSLIALGASGGLVPCPSALVLLLSAIALGRVALGMMLLLAFSTGLALVLMAIGAAVLYAKNLVPDRARLSAPVLRYLPVFSAVVVIVLGLVMTGVSIGWIQPGRIIG